MSGKDPDDWVHSAAAIAGGAHVLLTRDTAGFPREPLRRRGLRVTNADRLLCEQFTLFPDDLVRVLENQVEDLTRSRLSLPELLDRLDHPGGGAAVRAAGPPPPPAAVRTDPPGQSVFFGFPVDRSQPTSR